MPKIMSTNPYHPMINGVRFHLADDAHHSLSELVSDATAGQFAEVPGYEIVRVAEDEPTKTPAKKTKAKTEVAPETGAATESGASTDNGEPEVF